MAETLTLLEHEAIPVVRSRRHGQKELEQKHADALGKLERKLPSKAWSWGNREVKFSHYCGVVSLGDISIEILPKIYGAEAEVGSSREALVRMLASTRRLKLHKAGSAQTSLQKHSLLDVFILHFCAQLRDQLKQGAIRRYVKREKNLNVLRGRLLTERQFKFNLAHRERLFCRYDELSEDNLYNQILKFVLEVLLRTAKGNRAVQEVSGLFMQFDPISDRHINIGDWPRDFDRLTNRYESIFQWCRCFLEGYYPDVLGKGKSCLSVLFDMNRLFEAYVGTQLRRDARGEGLRVREQGPQRYFATRRYPDMSRKPVFCMKPDISLMDKEENILCIADAKWKVLDEEKNDLGITQADMYQMGSYALRYGAKHLMLIYPMQEKLTKPVRLTLDGTGANLFVLPFDLSERRSHSPALACAIRNFLSSVDLSAGPSSS